MKYINYASGIYKIVDFSNEILYVGKATDFLIRYKQHLAALKKGQHEVEGFQKYADQIGLDNLSFVVIEPCRIEHLDIKESFYIKKMRPLFNYCHTDTELITKVNSKDEKRFIQIIGSKQLEKEVSMDDLLKITEKEKINISPKMMGVLMVKMGFKKIKKRSENNKTYYLPASDAI